MIETIAKNERFSEGGETIYDFAGEFLVVCPKCDRMGKVFPVEITSKKLNERLFAPRRMVCTNCVYRSEWRAGELHIGASYDWYFRLPLWLQVECAGETLWAYNEKHLAFIGNYAAAKLRERTPNTNKSLASRLPSWIKRAKNRDRVLKAVERLREKLNGKA
jgi:hypothetical protein